ncbi:MAG TPA: OsmC domain/YcaO domain-containing protein [Bacteriovoracaceae bacterium]|nr:OsmC domain/YcaO domain-containing protein [Bacteriovoracaceae bacterium]
MQVNVRFLENLRLEASFDDFTIIADQPIRYKGDGTAPGPYDYFLASSALCAAYFVKVYCVARGIPTDDIKVTQNNIVDPDNRYNQTLNIEIELPDTISDHDREGILKAMDRCTVKRVIQNNPGFKISPKNVLGKESSSFFEDLINSETKTMIPGKDASLEDTVLTMTSRLQEMGINIEISSWRNPVPNVWSVHIRDADSPMCFTNGKGATKLAALCSALGEYFERLSTNYFYNDFYLGKEIAESSFVHYPNEKWFKPGPKDSIPNGLMDDYLIKTYGNDGELKFSHLFDASSGNPERGVCAIPFVRQSDGETVYIPVNLISNLFVSNGMSAGNTLSEARVQALSEIFERAVKSEIIANEISLPDVPKEILERYPRIMEGINKLEEQGFPVLVKDASLGGKFPVMNVTLLNPRTGGAFASFGAHPKFEVALERTLTELLQGRSFEGLNDFFPPTFNEFAVKEHNNLVDHFIDSSGVISWKFFSAQSDYEFCDWDFSGSTEEEYNYLMSILNQLEKEVYIADYEELGAKATRILVPNYSEIYEFSDLMWDNNNRAINFREDILNIHQLDDKKLEDLVDRLDESGIDIYTTIAELIGVAFDENSVWGQMTIGELRALSLVALGRFEEAKDLVEMLSTFSNSLPERKKFYQALNIALDIEVSEDLDLADYIHNLRRMYGNELMEIVTKTLNGELKFYGLFPTDTNLTGVDKHLRLIESYHKIQKVKADFHKA